MKRYKKAAAAFIIMLTMIIGLFPRQGQRLVRAEEKEKAYLWLESSVQDGDVILKVLGNRFSDIMQLDFELDYDSALMSPISYDDTYLKKKYKWVMNATDDSEDGKIKYSIFSNDVNPFTIEKEQVFEIRFHPEYKGTRDLNFTLSITDCKDNVGGNIYSDAMGTVVESVTGIEDVEYACGLLGVSRVRPGETAKAEFYAHRETSVSQGTFLINYDPVKIRFDSCKSNLNNILVRAADNKKGQIKIEFETVQGTIGIGKIFEINFLPVKNNTNTVLKMKDLEMTDLAGEKVSAVAYDTLNIYISQGNEDYQFSLQANESVKEGKTLTAVLSLDKNKGYSILDSFLTYDPEVLEYSTYRFKGEYQTKGQQASSVTDLKSKDAKGNPKIDPATGKENPDCGEPVPDGKIRIQMMDSSDTGFNQNGSIMELDFKVKSQGTGYTYLDFFIHSAQDSFYSLITQKELSGNADGCCIKLLDPSTPDDPDPHGEDDPNKGNGKDNNGGNNNNNNNNNHNNNNGKNNNGSGGSIVVPNDDTGIVYIQSVKAVEGGVKILWNPCAAQVSGFVISKKTGSGVYIVCKIIESPDTDSWVDPNVKNGTTYSYQVRALFGNVGGKNGNTKTILFLNKPSIKKLTSPYARAMHIKIKKNKKASKYKIQLSLKKNFSKIAKTVKVSSKKNVSKTITGLKKGKKYYVRVLAYKNSYQSAWSSKKSVKIKKK